MRAVNLIPAEQRRSAGEGAGRSGGGAYAVLALIGGLALFAFVYGTARHDVSSRRGEAALLNARASRAQAAAMALAPYTKFIALREERVQAVSQLVDSRFDWAHTFHELGRVLPASAAIGSIDGTIGSSAGPGAQKASSGGGSGPVASSTPTGSVPTFTISGCATSQAEVALVLNRLRLIDGVSDVTLQNSTKGNASGGGSVGQCPVTGPTFTVQLTFDPLPAPTALKAATTPAGFSGGSR